MSNLMGFDPPVFRKIFSIFQNPIFLPKNQGQLLRVSFIEVLNLITIVILLYNSILSHALTHR